MTTAASLAGRDARLAPLLQARGAGEGWEKDEDAWTSPGWRGAKEKRWSELGARLPARSDGAIEIGVSQFGAMRIRLLPRGADGVNGKLERGHLVYAEAYGGDVDVVMTTTRVSVEELLVLRQGADHFAFSWGVELSSGIARAREDARGSVVFLDARGERVLTVPPAYAIDARGEKRAARLSWSSASRTLSVELDARGLTFPVLLDPAFETAVWEQLSPADSPPARIPHAGMTYDAARAKVVLFGGYRADGDLNDTWTWDGTTWTDVSPATSPPERDGHALAYDAAHGKVVLFGGVRNDQATFLNDTWTWDGTTWTDVTPATSPPPRESHAMAYDAARGKIVMFAGWSWEGSFNDTWTWDGTSWTDVSPALSPTPRDSGVMAYDPVRGQLVSFGGSRTVSLNDTWTWDGASWTQLAPATSPTTRDSMAMVFDPLRGTMVLFGGVFNDTWAWDGATWAPLPSAVSPLSRTNPGMAFDAAHGNVVLFGGNGGGNGLQSDTWVYHARGGGCTDGSSCASGHCVDGVCCETTTCGTCQACDRATPGVCSPITDDVDADSCAGLQACDGTGTCKAALGQACSAGQTCASGSCVDGVCCDSSACGFCEACSAALKVTGASGSCGLAKDGLDPRNDCPDDGTLSCQRNGMCDGKGGCALYAPGTSCGTSVCSLNRATGRVCNGFGTCANDVEGVDCAPYVCNPATGACASPCTRDDQCVLGDFCNEGTCKPRLPYGSACTGAAACPVGAFCVDGVCCNTPCQGQCEACDLPAAKGTCVPILGAAHGARPACATAAPSTPCAAATCNGVEQLSCRGFVGSAVSCRSASCVAGVESLPATCDGKGGCPTAVTKTCAPYVCGAKTCKNECAIDADCAPGNRCDTASSRCVSGATCTDNHTLVTADGNRTDCTPFTCEGQACRATCNGVEDCIFPASCDGSGQCVLPTDTNTDVNAGCAVGRPAPRGWATAWTSLLVLALLVRRGRRRANAGRGGGREVP